MKLPEILTQNRPKYMKLPKNLPEISIPYTNRGGGAVPPPTSYAYDVNKNKEFTNMQNFFPDLRKQNVLFANKPNNTPDKEPNQRFMFRRQK